MDSSLVYLVQTDTTVGFSSSNHEKLSDVKQRPRSKKILHTVDSFKTLQKHTRIPKKYRKEVRRASLTTYIYPNQKSFRVINKNSSFYEFIHKFGILYSTSANKTGKNFEYNFAKEHSNIIIEDKNNFFESSASKIIKITKSTKNTIR
ncbi:Sua5 YciO YrdC YwlC family protein [Arcobacter peruensis]|uniref:Sua5 YciO YrdC YwlC family protein n=1 Tax=Arcobacter peruensis TaxID=2320140 RepID=UPI000F07EFF4|nr:Sua5 YciO YrdC YwlC family protein [Arcobacter peruensis]